MSRIHVLFALVLGLACSPDPGSAAGALGGAKAKKVNKAPGPAAAAIDAKAIVAPDMIQKDVNVIVAPDMVQKDVNTIVAPDMIIKDATQLSPPELQTIP